MRYNSQSDAHVMRRMAGDPSRRVRAALSGAHPHRVRRVSLGALTQIGSGSTVSSAAAGASMGASIGSVVPVIGTAVGALVGGAVGAIASAFNRQDKENVNFQAAMQLSQQQGASAVLNLQNKYLVLAGLFDLEPSQIKGNIPIYRKYGRMGEQKFVTDMCTVIQNAANAGQITDSDTPQTVFQKVVQPWINRFGFGSMSDSNADMINYILMGMIAEFCANIFTQRWFAIGGQMPFGNIPAFSLPQASQPAQPQAVTGSASPSPTSQAASTQTEIQQYQAGKLPGYKATVNYAYNGSAFLALPQPMTYEGADPSTRGWIVSLAGQMYELQGSNLVPYPLASAAPAPTTVQTSTSVPAPVAASGQTVTPQVNEQVTPTVTAMDANTGASIPAQYISSGGGGYYPAPTTVSTAVAPVASGFNMTELGIGAAVLLGVVFLMMQKKGAS